MSLITTLLFPTALKVPETIGRIYICDDSPRNQRKPPKPYKGNKSAGVLPAMTRPGMTLREIAKAAGAGITTTHNQLIVLTTAGEVRRVSTGKGYCYTRINGGKE